MASGRLDGVLQHIRKLVAAEGGGAVSDRELLQRFVRRRDEEAFAALVQRHGPMVLAVCRRVLGNPHDAEDACQAAFLILARKAASIRKQSSVGSWLHGVAYRAAANLKRAIARRRTREAPVVDVAQAEPAEVTWREVRAVLDEELQRLPERFRAPLLLCCLEGKTRDEAAQELGWSVGTVRGRLERGRALLRARLTRRGVTLSAALLAALLAGKAVAGPLPAGLVVTIVKAALLSAAGRAAAGAVSARVAAVTEGVLRAMLITRLKLVAAVLFVVGLAGIGAGVWSSGMLTAQPPDDRAAAPGAADPTPTAGDKRDQPADAAEVSRNAARSRDNLKQIVLAMHNYNDTMGHLPAPAIYAGERYPGSGGVPASQPGGPTKGSSSGPSGPGTGSSPGGPPAGSPPGGMAPTGPGGSGPPATGQPGSPGGPGGPAGSMPPAGPGSGALPGMGPRSALAGDGPPLPGTKRPSALSGNGPALPGSGGPPGSGQPGAPGGTPPMGSGPPGGTPSAGSGRPGGMAGGSMGPGGGVPGMTGAGAPGGGGKALLSWRVTLLPYLGEDNLYKQFKLDEPWDGPHNKKLLERMPKVYAAPGVKTRESYTTFYQIFVGTGAPFEKHQLARIPASFPDGTSNTILIAEAGNAVPWTKPEDLHFALDEPLPELGGAYPGLINVAFADGAATALSAKADPDMLRALITPAGGEVVDVDKLRAPTSPHEAQLRKQNDQLKQELEKERAVLEELQREKQQLQQEDAGTEQLKKENARLEELLKKTRDEAELLRQEIQRLKKAPEKQPDQGGPGVGLGR